MNRLPRCAVALLAALLFAPVALADEGEDDVVLLGPPPTPYTTKQVKARFLSVHADCDATLTATFTTPGVAAFLKKSDKSKGSVLSHSFRIKPLMPGVTILSVTVDFADELKEDTLLQVPLTFLPDAKPVGKAIKVGSKPILKDLKVLSKDVLKAIQEEAGELVGDADFSTPEDAQWAVSQWVRNVYLKGDQGLAQGATQGSTASAALVKQSLEDAGYLTETFLPFVPDAVQRGTCEERDELHGRILDTLDKSLAAFDKALAKQDKALTKEAASQGGAVDVGALIRSRYELDLPVDLARGLQPPNLLYVSAVGARHSVAGVTGVLISGTVRDPGGDDLMATLKDLASGATTPVDLGATSEGFRPFDITEGLKPGGQYLIEVKNINTGDTREVFVTTPGAPALQAGD